jgi:hypothetical protein
VTAPWSRPAWSAGGGEAEVVYVAFSELPLPQALRLDRARHGLPADQLPPQVRLLAFDQQQHADWIRGFFDGALGTLGAKALGWSEPPIARAQHAFLIRGTFADPSDLSYLQACRALLRALAWGGAFCAVDAHSHVWVSGEDLRAEAVDAPFDALDHVALIFETDGDESWGHVAHSRGLRKFGRPDVVLTRLTEEHGERVGHLLAPIVRHLCDGHRLGPGGTVSGPGGDLLAIRYVPGISAPDLHLNNDGLLLRPDGPEARQAHVQLLALLSAAAEA